MNKNNVWKKSIEVYLREDLTKVMWILLVVSDLRIHILFKIDY